MNLGKRYTRRMRLLPWAVILMLLCPFSDLHAQDLTTVTSMDNVERNLKVLAIADSVDRFMAARYYKTPYDSNYVVRPKCWLTLKLRLNQSGDGINVKGTIKGNDSKADLNTSMKTTVSIGASYRGLSLSLAMNPAKWSGKYSDYEFSLTYYSSKLSLDASYHRASTLSGDIRHGDIDEHLEEGDVNLKVANLAGYYVFNNKRFSYPAAFTQSYIQRRSAGSWLLGLSYQGGTIETREELKERNPNAPELRIKIGNLGIGGGYGYNLVLGKRKQWLIHGSMTPTFVIYNHNKMEVNGVTKKADHINFNMIFNERVAIVWNFSPRYFASATLHMNNSILNENSVTFNQNKWRMRWAVGMRI